MPGPQASDIDATIKQLADHGSVIGYVIISSEGIPVKYHERVPYDKAVQYGALFSDFCAKARRALKDLLPGPDVSRSLQYWRLFSYF